MPLAISYVVQSARHHYGRPREPQKTPHKSGSNLDKIVGSGDSGSGSFRYKMWKQKWSLQRLEAEEKIG